MATHGDIGLSQPASGTTTFKLDAISLDANSTVVLREVMVLGSPETTNALMAVLNAAPASTAWAGVVRIAGGPSSVADLAVRAVLSSTSTDNVVTCRSSAANLLVSVYQSTQSELKAQVAPISSSGVSLCFDSAPASTVQAIAVRPVGGGVDYTHASGALTVSTVTGPAILFRGTSTTPAAVSTSDTPVWGAADLRGRQLVSLATVFPEVQTYAASTAGQSTLTQIVSSAATTKIRVCGLQITTTSVSQNTIEFYASSRATLLFNTRMSSAVMGFNMAVTPPGYLFSVSTGQNLAMHMASTADHAVVVSYFLEP